MDNELVEAVAKAAPLLKCEHRANRPNDRVPGERIVGFVIGEDEIGLGLSEPLLALDALVKLAEAATSLKAENEALREALEELNGATADLHRACLGVSVGGGDGGTYAVGIPSAAILNRANIAGRKARAALTKQGG